MTDVIRKPERRMEDVQTILNGKREIEGVSKFGNSKISTFFNDYIIDIPCDKTDMRISLVIDGSGRLKYSSRYFDREPSDKPLSPAELDSLKEPVVNEDKIIDETIATFYEGLNINPHDKEIAIQEESEKITASVRNGIIKIQDIDAIFCKSESDKPPTKKSEVVPSVVNSFADRDWMIVVETVRQKIRQEGLQQII